MDGIPRSDRALTCRSATIRMQECEVGSFSVWVTPGMLPDMTEVRIEESGAAVFASVVREGASLTSALRDWRARGL